MPPIRVHLPAIPSRDSGESGDRSYEIHCGPGLLSRVGPLLREAGAGRGVIVADQGVAGSHAAAVARSLADSEIPAPLLVVPAGEGSKSVAGAARLWGEFAGLGVDRQTHVVAVGGGVVGDLAGFVAATFARGIPVWQVPTTVVAQVDSAIGGKTGINLDAGKNLVGVFWQPRGVIADIDALRTLPDREFLSGLAEVVKYGMILDGDFFAWLEAHAADLVARKDGSLAHAIERSAAIKAGVVERDERETSGLRAALNYGHTFGHAYETAAGYGTLLHGEAVAIGMGRAARLAAALGMLPTTVVSRQDRLLEALHLPVLPPASLRDADQLIAIMGRDKKTVGGRLRFVLPNQIGAVELIADVPTDAVRRVLLG